MAVITLKDGKNVNIDNLEDVKVYIEETLGHDFASAAIEIIIGQKIDIEEVADEISDAVAEGCYSTALRILAKYR